MSLHRDEQLDLSRFTSFFLNIEAATLMDVLDQDCLDISELDLFNFLLKLASDREILNEISNTDNLRDSPVQNAKIKKMNLVR
ncbi:hypothetical protein ACLKA6_001389 [Drosophila palustris]